MFDKIGKFSARFRYPIIIFWVVTVILITLLAPNLSDVSISDQSSFLSNKAPSIKAAELMAHYFPDEAASGGAVVVLYSPERIINDTPEIATYISDLTSWLENDLDPTHTIVSSVLSPTDPTLTAQLTSKDGKVVIITLGITGSMDGTGTEKVLHDLAEHLKSTPAGVEGYITGTFAISNDYKNGALNSVATTTLITVVLVITILLIIYRSPVLPFVPLLTIGIAYGVSRGIVAWLAQAGMVVSSLTDVFIVVLLFGAGTDYCLFIVSRFREFMADDYPSQKAVHNTVARVGETIASSASTVIVGMIAMTFVELKIFANSGPSMALSIFIALLAGLTLTPAMLAVLGRHAFWPGKPQHAGTRAIWARLASWVARRPWVPLAMTLIILVPLAVYGLGHHRNFDLLADLPSSDPAKAGYEVLADHFGAGEMQPQGVLMTNLPDGHSPQGIAAINDLTQMILKLEGVADVRSLTLPAGKNSPEYAAVFQVDTQLTLMANGIQSMFSPDITAGSTEQNSSLSASTLDSANLNTVMIYLADLGKAFPELSSNADYQTVVKSMTALQSNSTAMLYQLPVSSQLTMISANLSQAVAQTGSNSQAGVDQVAFMGAYLTGLGQALPAVAQMDGYADALAAAAQLEGKAAELSQLTLLPNQLGLIASSFEETAAMLKTDPMALAQPEGSASITEQMAALKSYVDELGTAFPELKASSDYATVKAAMDQMTASDTGSMDLTKVMPAIPTLASGFRGLANTAAVSLPQATFVPQTSVPGMDTATLLGDVLPNLSSGLERLSRAVAAAMPEAKYAPATLSAAEQQAGVASLMADVTALQAALKNLAATFSQRSDNYFLPTGLLSGETASSLTRMLDMYVSKDGEAARLQVVLSDQPFSNAAIDTVTRLRTTVESADHGYVSGGTAVLYDLRDTMARDTRLVMILVLSGIAVVLLLLLRSVVAPLYLILTILLSYASTLGITRLVFEGILHTNLTWFVPFFIFVLLMALGMDYNIFLMGRVKEETAENGTRAGVQRAMERTGGIITSAGIIMAGTFAAMMSSSLVGLVQLAFAITVGVLLDTFVIRTTLVPAIAMLLGKWNWWPRKKA